MAPMYELTNVVWLVMKVTKGRARLVKHVVKHVITSLINIYDIDNCGWTMNLEKIKYEQLLYVPMEGELHHT